VLSARWVVSLAPYDGSVDEEAMNVEEGKRYGFGSAAAGVSQGLGGEVGDATGQDPWARDDDRVERLVLEVGALLAEA